MTGNAAPPTKPESTPIRARSTGRCLARAHRHPPPFRPALEPTTARSDDLPETAQACLSSADPGHLLDELAL
jgi:hypothetical protein